MVVEEVEDLDVLAVGEVPVGGVGLPHLVGEGGLEADEGGAGALLGLRGDQAVAGEDAPDGAGGGNLGKALEEVVADAGGAGVVAGGVEFLAEGDDRRLELGTDLVGAAVGAAGARGQGVVPAGAEAGDQLVDPALGDAVEAGELAGTPTLQNHRIDDVALEPHGGNPP